MPAEIERRFARLAEQERRAIRSGDYAALGVLNDTREALLARLAADRPDAATLRRIAADLTRTDRLLAASQRGLVAARKRLEEIAGGASLDTYSATGQRTGLAPVRRTVTRRA